MPRSSRIHVANAFYLVTLSGNHNQDIFFCDAHRKWLDEIVAETIERLAARIHAHCWLTNRMHLLVQVSDQPLSRIMLRIASLYARRVQAHLSTMGHLFQRRYHAVLVDSEEYLLTLIRHIHLCPVRESLVARPEDYSWSSHRVYAGLATLSWVTTDLALRMFHVDTQVARENYGRFIQRAMAQELSFELFAELNVKDPRVLGDDNFLASIQSLTRRPRSFQTIDEVIADACRVFDVSVSELESRSGRRKLARARAWIAHRCSHERIGSVSQVARRFGRDESTLRESILRYTKLICADG